MRQFSNDIMRPHSDFSIEKMLYKGDTSMQHSHYHAHYEILYLLNGTRTLILDAAAYTLTPENIVLIKPFVPHKTICAAEESQTRILVNISADYINNIAAFLSQDILRCFQTPVIPLDYYQYRIIRQLLFTLLDAEGCPAFCREIEKTYLCALLLELTKLTNSAPAVVLPNAGSMQTRIRQVMQFIQNHYNDPLSLPAVAREFGMSEGHLSRNFRKYSGIPFIKYLNAQRIEAAKRLLSDNTVKIQAISTSVGFRNITHFERIFKNQTGISPKAYRAALLRNQGLKVVKD